MRYLAPFFIVVFATVVYSKKWREYAYRDCCSCEDTGKRNNKWTVTQQEIQKPEKGGEGGGGGGSEDEGGGGGKGEGSAGGSGGGEVGGGGSEEEGSKRRRGGKRKGGEAEVGQPRKGRKKKGEGSEEELDKRRKGRKKKGDGSEEELGKRRKGRKKKGDGSEEEGGKRRRGGKEEGGGSEEEGGKRRKGRKEKSEGSEEEGGKRRKGRKHKGGESEEEGGKRRKGRKHKGGGKKEEGGKRPEGGGSGGKGEGGEISEDGYKLRDGLISGDEPTDFNGGFTKAMRKLQRQVLKRHNKWRRLHGVPPLEHSEELCRYAQAYAYRLAQKGKMKHRTTHKYGENLFVLWSSDTNLRVHGKKVVDAWYDEIKLYKWKEVIQPATGHFTQVVWKKSRKVGSGIAMHKGKIFVVSNYDPPGNVMGRFMKNVLKPGGGGGEDEGGQRPEGGGSGGGGGEAEGGSDGGYDLRDGLISGNEPTDFNGKFTKAMRKLQREVLKRHNKWRRLHGVAPVQESEELNRYAQAYAYRLAQRGQMKHRTTHKYGENLFYSWSSDPNAKVHGKQVVDAWYDEIKMYKWTNSFQAGCGHFTQVVWRTCKFIGSGIARHNGKIFVVTNYDPPGNFMGTFLKNVPRPGSGGGGGGEEGGKAPPGGGGGGGHGGGEEGGGKGHGGGREGDGGKKDDYIYYEGVVSGKEPTDFKGSFTKAMRKLQRQVLKRSNMYRRKHGVPPLEHSEKLCRYAQAYAYRLAQTGKMKHRTTHKYGENLFYGWSFKPDYHVHGKKAVDAWYDEIKLHKWTNTFQWASGHFTALIWKASKYVGSGIAKHNGKIFIVSNYDPHGNVEGQYLENVPRPVE